MRPPLNFLLASAICYLERGIYPVESVFDRSRIWKLTPPNSILFSFCEFSTFWLIVAYDDSNKIVTMCILSSLLNPKRKTVKFSCVTFNYICVRMLKVGNIISRARFPISVVIQKLLSALGKSLVS